MSLMKETLAHHFKVETKSLPACSPRSCVDSVIDITTDKLVITYDKYVPTEDNPRDGLKVNIVFLHGLGMNRSIWEYYIVKMLRAAKASDGKWRMGTLLLIDQINHGDSGVVNKEKLGANYDWADGSRDFCKVASKELVIRKGETNILIGHSMGGCQAIICSLLSPVLFSLVIAMEPVIITRTLPTVERISVLKPSFYNALRSRSQDTFADENQYNDYQKKVGFYGNAHPEIFERFKNFEKVINEDGTVSTKANIDQVMITYLSGRPTGDWVASSLKFLKAPLVVMFGTKSNWCPPENRDLIEQEVPNVISEDIEGGTHLMNLEIPDVIIPRITHHIERHVRDLPPLQCLDKGEERQTRFRKLFNEFTSKRLANGKHLYPYNDPRASPRVSKL